MMNGERHGKKYCRKGTTVSFNSSSCLERKELYNHIAGRKGEETLSPARKRKRKKRVKP